MSGIVWQRVLEERMPGPPDAGPILAFAEPRTEAACVATGPVMAPLASLAVIRVHGRDAQAFLHAQLTADIAAMPVGGTLLAAWCTAKGRVVATLHVVRRDEDFLLALSADLLERVLARLRMFVLRSKVQLDDLHDEIGVLGCAGEAALDALSGAPVDDIGDAVIVPASTPGDAAKRALLLASPELLAESWDRLSERGVLAVGEKAWRRVLILAGEPHVTAATSEAFIPQMLNLDALGGISFDKGCYPGQEIVARTRYLGQLKRRMFIGRCATTEPPQAGCRLYLPGAEQMAGEVLLASHADSNSECELLAIVRTEAAQMPLHLATQDGAATRLRPVPYPIDSA